MLIEQALMTYLLAQSGITALVGQRIYFVIAPQETAKPYIVVTKIDAPEVGSHDGPAELASPRFQLSVFAVTYSAAKNISAAIKTALDGYSGTMGGAGGLHVDIPRREDENDFYEESTGLFQVASDYIVWYQE
jgi:hypothetical protein